MRVSGAELGSTLSHRRKVGTQISALAILDVINVKKDCAISNLAKRKSANSFDKTESVMRKFLFSDKWIRTKILDETGDEPEAGQPLFPDIGDSQGSERKNAIS